MTACVLERVSSYKLLGLWIDDDLKWKTNTEYIVKKVAKRLHFLKILKGYNAPREDLKTFYTFRQSDQSWNIGLKSGMGV